MTLEELQAKREEILASIGIMRIQFGDRSIQYADAQRALAAIDQEIERLSRSSQRSVSYAEYSKG
ncbi:hypothetical protein [Candidatus Roseilinea sp. NK_OTU-006]|jgi:hypothetical protein|uniref:hypothetical protein n=1 Tax=Candidatus Roseilinea sp. NK_OTU-006 TaxID=2704250 RepID=UPI00145F817D|nr:hypothetical protein [Candidatus Roseilinea sp. NK_OTU-006]